MHAHEFEHRGSARACKHFYFEYNEGLTPALQLATLYNFDGRRSTTTREPGGGAAPAFSLIRGATSCVWAVHVDVATAIADELEALAREEPPTSELRSEPIHSARYRALAGDRVYAGPAFGFPDALAALPDVVVIDDERELAKHFSGWVTGEIAEGRAPVVAVVEDGAPVSVCFCARRSNDAAEAGVETAAAYRKRGYATRAATAWACAVRARHLTPLYSTSWTNAASLATARSLGLVAYASNWNASR